MSVGLPLTPSLRELKKHFSRVEADTSSTQYQRGGMSPVPTLITAGHQQKASHIKYWFDLLFIHCTLLIEELFVFLNCSHTFSKKPASYSQNSTHKSENTHNFLVSQQRKWNLAETKQCHVFSKWSENHTQTIIGIDIYKNRLHTGVLGVKHHDGWKTLLKKKKKCVLKLQIERKAIIVVAL